MVSVLKGALNTFDWDQIERESWCDQNLTSSKPIQLLGGEIPFSWGTNQKKDEFLKISIIISNLESFNFLSESSSGEDNYIKEGPNTPYSWLGHVA